MMKFNTPLIVVLTTLAIFISACTEEADKIGLDIQPPGDRLHLFETDTITALAYSVREDSVRTDEITYSLLGSYFDPVFGMTTASFYSEFRLSIATLDFGESPVMDSLVLSLAYHSIWGDSTTIQTFRVFEMTENIHFDSAYYSTTVTAYDQQNELGSVSVIPSTDSILIDTVKHAPVLRIRLNQRLADKLLSGTSENFVSNDNFRQFFKGLYITADPVNVSGHGAIVTFNVLSENTSLIAYYRNQEEDSLQYTFSITSASARYGRYNHYNYENADPTFRQQVIEGNTELGRNIIYLQPLGGVKTYLKFPSLNTLGSKIKSGEIGTISVSEARIYFTNAEPEFALPVPSRLILAQIINDKGSTIFLDDHQEGDSYFDGFYRPNQNKYRFRLSQYVQNRLLNPESEDFGLALLIPSASLVAERVILKGSNAEEARIRLVITYTKIE